MNGGAGDHSVSSPPLIVPIVLGCCPNEPRCILCSSSPTHPSPRHISALVDHYRDTRLKPGQDLMASFFGGPPPSQLQLDAIGDVPFSIRVRPDLLSRNDVSGLVKQGLRAVELDVGTFNSYILRRIGRKYSAEKVELMLNGLEAMGLRVGVVLAPGLPGTDFDMAVEDAQIASKLCHTVRIHPVLVFEGSHLHKMHQEGLYTPLTLGEAVTVCQRLMDILEENSVQILRVGIQPGPDEAGICVAGPHHSSIRELVEARRVLGILETKIADSCPSHVIVVSCAPEDETRVRGPENQNVRNLRAAFSLKELTVVADPKLHRGHYLVTSGGTQS